MVEITIPQINDPLIFFISKKIMSKNPASPIATVVVTRPAEISVAVSDHHAEIHQADERDKQAYSYGHG